MTDAPSFQDFLTDFTTEIFVGRGEQLVRFEKALITERPPFLILAISGPPGVGKTTLLEQLHYIADDHAVLTAQAREEQTSVPATLAHLARQIDEVRHPFDTFAEPTSGGGNAWFRVEGDRPAFFAGLYVPGWTSVRKLKDGETTDDLYGFLTTSANAVVGAIHPKAMPVILTQAEDWETWLRADWSKAQALQRPLPEEELIVEGSL